MKPEEILKDKIISVLRENKEFLFEGCKIDLNALLVGKRVRRIKEVLMSAGSEFLKEELESHDSTEKTLETDQGLFRFKYKSKKEFCSLLGHTSIERNVYQQDKGGKTYSPLDEKVGIAKDYLTTDLKEPILYACAHNTPYEVSDLFEKLGIVKLDPSTVRKVMKVAGAQIEEYHDEIYPKIRSSEKSALPDQLVVASMDGVNLLKKEVGGGGKKGRPQQRPGGETKEVNTAYRNANCGSVSIYKTIQKDGNPSHERLSTKYMAYMPQEKAHILKARLGSEIAATVGAVFVKIMLCDGHKGIWSYVETNPLYKDFEKLVDYYHAAEHLSLLAELLHGKSSRMAKDWYKKMTAKLKNLPGGVDKVIKSASYYLKSGKYSKIKQEKAQKQINYFRNNRTKMDYAKFIKNGWPIGSGVIEAACKTIVKQRMCRSGQRWTHQGGQPVLELRAAVKSKRWDKLWDEYSKIYYVPRAA